MSKELDLIKRQQPEIIDGYPTGNIYIGVTKEEFIELEKALKELEERREMMKRFNEACVPMVLDNETEEKLKAFEAIKNIGILKPYETSSGQCWLEAMCDATKITKDNYALFRKVGL